MRGQRLPLDGTLLAAAFLGGVLSRLLLVVFGADPVPAPYSDAEFYHLSAMNLVNGNGYSYLSEPTAFWPPGYPFFLAIVYSLFGAGVKTAMVANALAGGLTVLATYAIGRRVFGRAVALVGAGIMAVLPSHILWSAAVLSEVLFTLVFALAFWMMLESVKAQRVRWWWFLGFSAAVAFGIMIRGQTVILVPVALLLWWRLGLPLPRSFALAVLVSLIGIALVVPWSIRNTRVMGSPVILSTNVGYNLYIGHNPEAFGRFHFTDQWPAGEEGRLTLQREVEFNEEGLRKAARYALTHPLEELRLIPQKLYWLYRADTDSWIWIESFYRTPLPSIDLRFLIIRGVHATYYALLALAVVGGWLWFSLREPRRQALVLTILLWSAFHLVFFGEPRYHLPMLPFFALAAAHLPIWLRENWTALRTSLDLRAAPPVATPDVRAPF
jgi:4-amino-4-deoxy-L-arabinose transferase-like glycosyltransferase